METFFPIDSSKTSTLRSKNLFKDFSQAYFKMADYSSSTNYPNNNIEKEISIGNEGKILKTCHTSRNFDKFLKNSPFAKFDQEKPFNYNTTLKTSNLIKSFNCLQNHIFMYLIE
jgi:hypothetical protein